MADITAELDEFLQEALGDPGAEYDREVAKMVRRARDEIERLRILNEQWKDTCKRNADEIERLRAQIKKLRAADDKGWQRIGSGER